MKKVLLVLTGLLVGVVLEKKFQVMDLATKYGKKAKKVAKDKIREAVEAAEENIDEIKEESEEKVEVIFEETK